MYELTWTTTKNKQLLLYKYARLVVSGSLPTNCLKGMDRPVSVPYNPRKWSSIADLRPPKFWEISCVVDLLPTGFRVIHPMFHNYPFIRLQRVLWEGGKLKKLWRGCWIFQDPYQNQSEVFLHSSTYIAYCYRNLRYVYPQVEFDVNLFPIGCPSRPV